MRSRRKSGSKAAALQNVPKWELAKLGTKTQDVVVRSMMNY
jgi:hypothetical protein